MFRRARSSSMLWIIPLAVILLLSCNAPSGLPGAEQAETELDSIPSELLAAAEDSTEPGADDSAPENPEQTTSDPVQSAPTETPAVPIELPELSFAPQSAAQIPSQGEAVTAENGVVIQILPDSLSDGVEATLNQWAIDPSWREAIEQNYVIETSFVSLSASGVNDGQGRAVLRLPAASPDSRMATVIDNTYISLLDVAPQDVFLETAVRLGPSETGSAEQVGSLTPGGSLRFFVLTPNTKASASSKSHLSKVAFQDPRSCGIDLETYFAGINHCRKSADGSVRVNFLWGIGFSDAEGDQLSDAAALAMARYAELGFTAAKLTPRSPMEIVVETRSGDPLYRSSNGVIYLPVDAAKDTIGGTAHDTLHEMAHWIQDEEYNMAWAYWSGGKTWWLETAAENMVMLHDPTYISENLITYGPITTDDNRLAVQYTPYQWPADFYAHAQLVKLLMCADMGVCPLSEATFVEAINKGTYPYDSDAAKSKVSAYLDTYAQYLLGAAPNRGNIAMPMGEPVSSGAGYSEYVEVAQTNKSDFRISFNGAAPQMQKGSNSHGETVSIAATLQKDGVYPLSVSSGVSGRNPGLPIALTIQPGAPFWYRTGSDAPQFHDGSEELILQPIHLTMGLPGVRLVAMGKAGGETFQAAVSQLDLQGVWLVLPGEVVAGAITCQLEQSDGTIGVSQDDDGFVELSSIAGALGVMRPDPAGNSLTWEWNMDRLPAEASPYIDSFVQYSGAALPTVDKVQMQSKFTLQRSESQAMSDGLTSGLGLASVESSGLPLLLGFAAIVPGVWAFRRKRKSPFLALMGLLLTSLLLAGCFGMSADLWGTTTADMAFTELEYMGGETEPVVTLDALPVDTPLWKLSGTADYTVDSYVMAFDDESAATSHCTGTATYNVETQIFKDVILNLE